MKALINHPLPPPSEENHLQFEGYWIHVGTKEPKVPKDYVLTASVRANLKDLCRVVGVGYVHSSFCFHVCISLLVYQHRPVNFVLAQEVPGTTARRDVGGQNESYQLAGAGVRQCVRAHQQPRPHGPSGVRRLLHRGPDRKTRLPGW